MRGLFQKIQGALRISAAACPGIGCRDGRRVTGSGCLRCGGSGVFFRLS